MIKTTNVITNEEALTAALRKHCGKLWTVLDLTGISVFNEKARGGFMHFLYMIRKLFFPIFLHCNLLYLWYNIIERCYSKGEIDYADMIDVVVPPFSNILWWMVYTRRFAFKKFFNHIATTMSVTVVSQTRSMAHAINATLFLTLVYPSIMVMMMMLQKTKYKVSLGQFFRLVQEIIFPSIVGIMYTAICYLLLRNLQTFKNRFDKDLSFSSMITFTNLKKNYLDIVKGVEMFEDLFSAPVFIIVVESFCLVSIIIMDMMHRENWLSELWLEALFYLIFIFGTLGILTVYAGNIPLEMSRIKSVLLEKMSEQSNKDGLLCLEKQILYLMKKDAIVLTACNVFDFDRAFLLKALISVIAHAVIIYQLGLSISHSGKRNL
ncbi:uncharacterized protein NPIL_306961 [Nephila pilipes]|uniref:Gustatory receptor n=1 Tax=Nephila pilipes TaxID=299642 RepID=A0A8X6QNQ4_NEPPI|nr:uncharacterized protein NPIL_306961 [Nephila pilipes]